MEILTIALTATVGFLVGQASGYFERKSKRKETLNRALSALLEIRHRFLGAMYVIRQLASEKKIPVELYDEIIASLPDGLLWEDELKARYDEALDDLSSYAPVLSFMLRSKDMVSHISKGALIKFGNSEHQAEYARQTHAALQEALNSILEEAIVTLARLISLSDEKWAKDYLEKSRVPSEETVGRTAAQMQRLRDLLQVANSAL